MKDLNVALYAEGLTDRLFLPSIIQRSIKSLLDMAGQSQVIIPRQVEAIFFEKSGLKQEECILTAAHKAANYHVLVVHCDADAPTDKRAFSERFTPGYKFVQQASGHVCKSLIPIIPVRMTEAWMLAAEYELFRRLLFTDINARDLGLVNKVKQVEDDPDPKQTLKQIIQRARSQIPRRHRDIDHRQIYQQLGEMISLSRLNDVPSYKRFVGELTMVLRSLQFIF